MSARRIIPFLDLAASTAECRSLLDKAYARVTDSGWFVLGSELERFESDFAAYCGATHCVGVGCGLDALHFALRALGIGPGDEVIVPAFTYAATWLAVSHCGAIPVPVEPDEGTYNISPERIESSLTDNTRGIIVAHMFGRTADMQAITEIASTHHLKVIEDAAQAHGATYRGRRVGALADAAAFSFYPAKNLGALGDGGAVVTQDKGVRDAVMSLRNYGSLANSRHSHIGFNSKLDSLQASFLREKLASLDDWNQRRRAVAEQYLAELSREAWLRLPAAIPDGEHVWHLFVVRCAHRDRLRKLLQAQGIGTHVHYPTPPHLTGAYAERGWRTGDFPITETLADTVLSLPMGPHISSDDVSYVSAAVRTAGASLT